MSLTRSLIGLAVLVAISPRADRVLDAALHAQPVVVNMPPGTLPKTVPTTASVTINGAFALVPVAPALTQTTQQGNPCNPGACFEGSVLVNANQGWQLQVRVQPSAPTTFYVNWVAPTNTLTRLASTSWFVIQSSSTSASGNATALKFNANKATGKGGATPTAAQLSSYLEFRVVAFP